jgi:hypothetical protein
VTPQGEGEGVINAKPSDRRARRSPAALRRVVVASVRIFRQCRAHATGSVSESGERSGEHL